MTTTQLRARLRAGGLVPGTDEWRKAFRAGLPVDVVEFRASMDMAARSWAQPIPPHTAPYAHHTSCLYLRRWAREAAWRSPICRRRLAGLLGFGGAINMELASRMLARVSFASMSSQLPRVAKGGAADGSPPQRMRPGTPAFPLDLIMGGEVVATIREDES